MTTLLTASDYRQGVSILQEMSTAAGTEGAFAPRGVELLARAVASEITTLSVCHLASGRREVVGTPTGAINAADRACFDHFFNAHPLVRYHAYRRGPDTHRISDSIPFSRFRDTALYNEYYRRIGIDHAVAVPLQFDGDMLVSFVLNRRRRDFSARERARLEMLREGLSALYRQSVLLQKLKTRALAALDRWELTPRERDVMHWLSHGKTDGDIGEILGISARTVQKHLQRIYTKLGVETRTAAVMRSLAS
ncbi:MAG: LuxR C-terminal-related transcriptional regulator [Burkholderiaceae bacterium]